MSFLGSVMIVPAESWQLRTDLEQFDWSNGFSYLFADYRWHLGGLSWMPQRWWGHWSLWDELRWVRLVNFFYYFLFIFILCMQQWWNNILFQPLLMMKQNPLSWVPDRNCQCNSLCVCVCYVWEKEREIKTPTKGIIVLWLEKAKHEWLSCYNYQYILEHLFYYYSFENNIGYLGSFCCFY